MNISKSAKKVLLLCMLVTFIITIVSIVLVEINPVFGELHEIAGKLLIILMIIHIVLNWKSLTCLLKKTN